MPSLSQTHRPRRFSDVTGQQHITETLRAEVASGSLGHAFLFSGPRGVGKTTCARILAKALGCSAPENGEPCGVCPSCTTFQEGRAFDVIEIDAATHTGVDMIREAIVEHVRFAPAGKRKVYILDEAHMLSTASWNALLKTLEEPPAYAFFVFATTEWHKVPPTIVSRCQRFEFRRIREPDMVARLKQISLAEGWNVEEEVLKLIASRAEGCLRDAETLLGQIGSLAEDGKITLATAGLVLPLSAYEYALTWLELCRDQKAALAAETLQSWYDAGVSFPTLVDDLLHTLKKLLLALSSPELAKPWQEGTEEEQRLAHLLPAWTAVQIHQLALILIDRRRDVKQGMDPVFVLLLAFTAAQQVKQERTIPPAKPVPAAIAPVPVIQPIAPKPVEAPAPIVAPTPVLPPQEVPRVDPVVRPEPVISAPVVPKAEPIPEPSPIAAATPVSSPEGGTDLATVRRLWNAYIRAVDEQNHSLPFILKISKPEKVEGPVLTIRFPYPFHRDKVIGDMKHMRIAEACARQVFGAPDMRLEGIVLGPDETGDASTPQDTVGNLLKAFGGSVVETP
ncbi:DNA polymerase III subunit gamma/tau [Patescibacteria group bacterium]|nr:DNA polymerase III subunit gamma/tau [Patescibacteria group bacterium]